MAEQESKIPLCVDLDGTLIKTDLLTESVVRVLKAQPWVFFLLPLWLLKGRHYLKSQLAIRSNVDIELLPFSTDLIGWLKEQKESGRVLFLVTGSNIRFAEKIAEHLGLFDEVIASDDERNVIGASKASVLVERFGEKNFDYAGNEKVDLHIWRHARYAIPVNAFQSTIEQAASVSDIEKIFERRRLSKKAVLKAVRIHQWMKNSLIFIPLFTAHQIFNPGAWGTAILGFIAFGLVASATYIVNDLSDLDADRAHHTKCKRPFASGDLTILFGMILAIALGLISLVLLLFLPVNFALVLLLYVLGTLSYTFRLKSVAMVDVIMLASLFTVRVIAGAAAISVDLSFWLMAFSVFVFLSLAMVKRVSELLNLKTNSKIAAKGRGYYVHDIQILKSMGGSSGYLAVLVLALYVNSAEVTQLYSSPKILWLALPVLLYWISRIWLVTARGEMHEDPIVYAIKDPRSWVVGAVIATITILATVI